MKIHNLTVVLAVVLFAIKLNRATVCETGEFQCSDGECITAGWRCDGDEDCQGKDDEVGCTYTCGPGSFSCASGQCIPEHWQCDNDQDCEDGSDENSTDEIRCPAASRQ
ncbi:very low-density lipoprotein receptor-like [Haliotis rufescens]|uniref:very low-density lipoprotein receptor-like n=1 Tax=Haliotis rufescens TaxID=6454 RepID=UPI00201E829E|nr:very low-density lipoprotein receptor-like [Haliotis rufescens]